MVFFELARSSRRPLIQYMLRTNLVRFIKTNTELSLFLCSYIPRRPRSSHGHHELHELRGSNG